VVDAVILDVNETLFSLDAVADRFAEVGLDGLLDVWFARILRDGFAAAAAGAFAPFTELARHHAAVLLDERGERVDEHRLDHLLDGFTRVAAHPDVEEGLRRLRDAGVVVTAMTNGTVGIAHEFLRREGLDRLVEGVYDVGMAGRWKPAPAAYRYVLDRHDLRPDATALISVHPWDIQGAVHAGLGAAWVNRAGVRYPEALKAPTVEGPDLPATVERLLSR
jgi:2-haloacid dehalogenase